MGQRIMAIDADTAILDLYNVVLSEEGYEVQLCPDGVSAYEQASAIVPDAIILDTHLGAPLTSWQLLGLLTEHPTLRTIPVLVATTHRRLLRDDGLTPRWSAVLDKPFDLDDLLGSLHRLLSDPRAPPLIGEMAGP